VALLDFGGNFACGGHREKLIWWKSKRSIWKGKRGLQSGKRRAGRKSRSQNQKGGVSASRRRRGRWRRVGLQSFGKRYATS